MERFSDVAIPIAWPDQTARGDEKWMWLLKKAGVVKNLNFRVGHAAIVLVEQSTGQVRYYDFGRYITPRGLGRARSAASDPRLTLATKGIIDDHGQLLNFEEILQELKSMEYATHGHGRLLCSISQGISFQAGAAYAEKLVQEGPIRYGALARKCNSCSRYVAQILAKAMDPKDPRISAIMYPEFVKASPTSNVINAVTDQQVFCYHNHVLDGWTMGRSASLRFQINLLRDNFTRAGASRLGDDSKVGHTLQPVRAAPIPAEAQWLGGIGEGRWFLLEKDVNGYTITRFDVDGRIEYRVRCQPDRTVDPSLPTTFTFDVHAQKHVLQQGAQKIVFITENNDIAPQQIALIQENIAWN